MRAGTDRDADGPKLTPQWLDAKAGAGLAVSCRAMAPLPDAQAPISKERPPWHRRRRVAEPAASAPRGGSVWGAPMQGRPRLQLRLRQRLRRRRALPTGWRAASGGRRSALHSAATRAGACRRCRCGWLAPVCCSLLGGRRLKGGPSAPRCAGGTRPRPSAGRSPPAAASFHQVRHGTRLPLNCWLQPRCQAAPAARQAASAALAPTALRVACCSPQSC